MTFKKKDKGGISFISAMKARFVLFSNTARGAHTRAS